MNKLLLTTLFFSGIAYAQNYDIKMLNTGEGGSMVFEPGYLKVQASDTVTFKATNVGHSAKSVAIPEGATAFFVPVDEEMTVTLDKEGVYVYACPPYATNNMNDIIQVGDAVPNREKAQKAVEKLEKKAQQNQGRLVQYWQQVK